MDKDLITIPERIMLLDYFLFRDHAAFHKPVFEDEYDLDDVYLAVDICDSAQMWLRLRDPDFRMRLW